MFGKIFSEIVEHQDALRPELKADLVRFLRYRADTARQQAGKYVKQVRR